MSGIAGIVHVHGGAHSRELLSRMARSLSFRGPDGQQIWTDESVALVHTAHFIKGDNTRSQGPETLGTGTWITADVRLDAREQLVAELRAAKQKLDAPCSDSRLLLQAYDAWGETCVDHLAGDFAFGIWDARRRQLFCACDQFGIRQLYFSKLESCLIFSNTLDCVRLHPEVSGRLNDTAICDFLLFGVNCDEGTTSFADIRRLPRAHWLKWSRDGIEIREYWRPPINGEIRYKKSKQYVEHFDELLEKAVADRVRTDVVGILLSGGIDSSSVTAVATEPRRTQNFSQVHAFTLTGPDAEDADSVAARIVADALQVPFHLITLQEEAAFQQWSSGALHFPEPPEDPFAADALRQSREIAGYTNVLLSGEGSDNLMSCEPVYHLRRMWRKGERGSALHEAVEHFFARFSAPDGLRGPMRRLRFSAKDRTPEQSPNWMNEDLVRRLKLKERSIERDSSIPWKAHPENPGAYASLFFPQWRAMFERQDPAYTRAAIDVRYPFLDLRLVQYLLAIPPMPWFFRKFLLREAMRGRLPEKIRKRAKVPNPEERESGAFRHQRLSHPRLCPEIEQYVNLSSPEWASSNTSPDRAEINVRIWCLNFWLESIRKSPVEAVAMVN